MADQLISHTLQLLWIAYPILAIHLAMKFIAKNLPRSMTIAALCTGVVFHELSHFIVAAVCGHKINRIVLFQPSDDGTLGYVSHSYVPGTKSLFTLFLIGLAPLVGCLGAFLLMSWFVLPGTDFFSNAVTADLFRGLTDHYSWLRLTIWLYLTFSIIGASVPSRMDLQGVYPLLTTLVVMCLFLPSSQLTKFAVFIQPLHTVYVTVMTVLVGIAIISEIVFRFRKISN